MINAVLYGILMFCCFVAIVTGRRTLIYASALLMPAIQVMPSLAGPPTSAPNLIVLGLIAGAFFHSRRRERDASDDSRQTRVPPAATATSGSSASAAPPTVGLSSGSTRLTPEPRPLVGPARSEPSFVRASDIRLAGRPAAFSGQAPLSADAGSVALAEGPAPWSA